MNWSDIFQIISSVIISVGGAGAIIWGLSSYFGNIWANRHLESIRKEYQKEIESYRSELDILRETSLRYSGQQFELYKKFWESIYKLKSIADELWEIVTESNLKKFSKQLKITIDEVEKSSLFIEDSHYKELKELLDAFNEYRIGKDKLITIYRRRNNINHDEITSWVERNGQYKIRYEKIIFRIRTDLRNQLRGIY